MIAESTRETLSALADAAEGRADLAAAAGLDEALLSQLTDRALGLIEIGKLEEGEQLLEDLTRVANLSFTLPFLLGAVRERRGDVTGAIAAYDEAVVRGVAAPESFLQRVHMCRGQARLRSGDAEGAIQDLEDAAKGPDEGTTQIVEAWLKAVRS